MDYRIFVSRFISVAVTTLLLSGCGALATPQPAVSTAPLPLAATLPPNAPQITSVTADFDLSDTGLTPKSLSVPVGLKVIFKVKNSLKANYSCTLKDLSTVKQYPGLVFWKLDNIAAGTITSGTFTAPAKPVSYEISCGVSAYSSGGTAQENITATLIVH